MNIFSWSLALSILLFLMLGGIKFHRATICRQEAWLKSHELQTRTFLTTPVQEERSWHPRCRVLVMRTEKGITWQRFPSLKKFQFDFIHTGKL